MTENIQETLKQVYRHFLLKRLQKDFHFLALTKFSDKRFWPPFYFASMLDRVLRGGDCMGTDKTAKQTSKLPNKFPPTNRVLRRFQDKNR